MKKCWGWVLTLSLSGLVGASWIVLSAERQPQANPGWSLLLISVGADHVAYGDSGAATPNLDQLAREGVLFEQVFTPVPLTLPAHASLFTAMYSPTNSVRDWTPPTSMRNWIWSGKHKR